MHRTIEQSDVTGTVNVSDPGAVADAVCAILTRRYEGFADAPLRRCFADVGDAFFGRFPGYLGCDTPYHDLRHALSTVLLMARMVDGYEIGHEAGLPSLGPEVATLAILLALFHDVGFLRRDGEAGMHGATLVHEHEQRSIDFARAYFARGPYAGMLAQVQLIHVTNFHQPVAICLGTWPAQQQTVGRMLGTVDLLSQIGGRYYLERCRDFLFPEFVLAGLDRQTLPGGETSVLYASAEDLLRQTPQFYEHVAKPRLEHDFDRCYRYIAAHFGGEDPYTRTMQRNLRYLEGVIRDNDFSLLRRKPRPLIPPVGGTG